MGFNRKDLGDDDDFNFDDDNSFDFGDNSDDAEDFKFDDEPSDIGLDDDAGGFGFEDEDMPEIEEEQSEGGGVSRTFIIIAAVMILLFVLGLAAVLFISTQNPVPTEFENQRATIIALNATTAADALLTATARAVLSVTETAFAQQPTSTPTLAPTDTPFVPTFTPTPPFDETQVAASLFQTQQAFDLTQVAAFTQVASSIGGFQPPQVSDLTEVAFASTAVQDPVQAAASTQIAILVQPLVPTQPADFSPELPQEQIVGLTQVATLIQGLDPTRVAQFNLTQVALAPTQGGSSIADVSLTATALAILLAPDQSTPIGVPTQDFLTPGVPNPTALPDTGFFDDLATGGGNVGMIALMAFGLAGVILVSRRLRTSNK